MCLAFPGKVEKIEGDTAIVNFGGMKKEIYVMLLEGLKVGEWVMVHAGFAISKTKPEEAEEILKTIEEIGRAIGR